MHLIISTHPASIWLKLSVLLLSAESPVLWIRLDPDMTLIRAVDTRQPDFQWQYQMKHERDITAQIEAIWALEQ